MAAAAGAVGPAPVRDVEFVFALANIYFRVYT